MIAQIALLILQPTPPPPTARWDTPISAVVTWSQQARGCLTQLPSAFVGCYDGAGRVRVSLGRVGPLSGDLRPMAGAVYRIVIDGVAVDVPLRGVAYFPVWR